VVHGRVGCQGAMAYSSQQAWIQFMTLKENILFGEVRLPHSPWFQHSFPPMDRRWGAVTLGTLRRLRVLCSLLMRQGTTKRWMSPAWGPTSPRFRPAMTQRLGSGEHKLGALSAGRCQQRLTRVGRGTSGINLSGGQKQRVSLARAVYSGCDVFLLGARPWFLLSCTGPGRTPGQTLLPLGGLHVLRGR
jgi:hypothetical protein